jgi:hypothetical protein
MKFMLMMLATRAQWDSLSTWKPEEFAAHVGFMMEFNRELTASGELVLAEGLDMPSQTKVVRGKQNGTPVVTDGPFAESKEFLAGFWIVRCKSAQRAYEIAARVSDAPGPGGKPMTIPVEVRQVMSAPDVPA